MPHKIVIDGDIGFWGVVAEDVRAQLSEANGQDIEIELSSGGGSVFEGIAIYNLIKNYEGKTSININGLAASMGSYIALAGDELTVSENSVFMIHNAWGFSGGDHKELEKTAKLLKSLSGLLNKVYVAKTGKSSEEVTSLMDDETWLFGSEIVDEGFADSVIEVEAKEEREEAVLAAMLKVEACNAKLKQEDYKEDLNKAAALFRPAEKTTPAPKANQQPTKEEVIMTPEEIKALQEKLAKAEADLKEAKSQAEPKEEPEAKGKIDPLAKSILKSKSYPDSITALALQVADGEVDSVALKATVAAYDAMAEAKKTDEAVAETDEIGPTPPQQPKDSGVNAKGEITSVDGLKAEAARIKEANGGK